MMNIETTREGSFRTGIKEEALKIKNRIFNNIFPLDKGHFHQLLNVS